MCNHQLFLSLLLFHTYIRCLGNTTIDGNDTVVDVNANFVASNPTTTFTTAFGVNLLPTTTTLKLVFHAVANPAQAQDTATDDETTRTFVLPPQFNAGIGIGFTPDNIPLKLSNLRNNDV